MEILENYSLKRLNWWKVGGNAEHFVEPASVEEVREAVKWAADKKFEVTVLGEGSNCLISDEGVSGLVISMEKLTGVLEEELTDEHYSIECLAGTPKLQLMQMFLKKKLTPALFLSGLPGQVGGGVVMNAGVREDRAPREFVEITDEFTVVDSNTAELKTYKNSDIEWTYRNTAGWQPGVIVSAKFKWPNHPDKEVPKRVVEANKLRKSKQPLEYPSGGSTFKNPSVEMSAGQLIDESGLKGFTIGGAQVSEKHANFIINTGDARSSDVWQVIQHVIKTVKEKCGEELHPEVRRIGKF